MVSYRLGRDCGGRSGRETQRDATRRAEGPHRPLAPEAARFLKVAPFSKEERQQLEELMDHQVMILPGSYSSNRSTAMPRHSTHDIFGMQSIASK